MKTNHDVLKITNVWFIENERNKIVILSNILKFNNIFD